MEKIESCQRDQTSLKGGGTAASPEKESRKPLLEEVQQIRDERDRYKKGEAEINMNKVGEDEDLQPNVTMRSTMSGLCSCLASFWVLFLFPFSIFCCRCSDFWEGFLGKFKPGFSDFSDGLGFMMKERVAEEDNRYFLAKAATTSLFVPCVIGTKGNTFKLSATVSLLVRTLEIVLVGLLYLFHFPPTLHSRTTILFCGTNETVANLPRQPRGYETCVGWNCFHFCPLFGNCSLTHRLRLCNDGDLYFTSSMGLILVLCQVLTIVSILQLNSLADYETLWEASQKTSCFCLTPIIHRTLTYKFIKEGNPEKLSLAQEDSTKEAAVRQTHQMCLIR